MLLSAVAIPTAAQAQQACNGAFPNLITDVCYDCVFPMSIMGASLNFGIDGEDYDTGVSSSPVCLCEQSLSIGTPVSFWEPRYMVDTTNKPGCMPLLGGIDINTPYNSDEYGGEVRTNQHLRGTRKAAFMQANEYINPVMSAIGAVVANPCLDNRSFDAPFLSWADPTWGDDALSLILTPYAYPFASVLSVAAEMPDAIAATVGFPLETLFWVAGAWGPMYPLDGNVAVANTPEQMSHLMIARLLAKLHAAGTQQTSAGQDALNSCGALGVPQIVMDKRQYKTNRTFPFPDNLCTPIGRPLAFQEIGAARPQDKDYGYFIFQRKDCCTPLVGANSAGD
ncbi:MULTISPECIES: TraU family protein [Paraburkholderia]|uniref:TraU family protein n=1 Tax=Paraburkholderia madseniana TaxID=2599607 RepID=A0AAP5BLT2_9BURK|nr:MULTISPECIES: TraU family protein [Paraburkholderia]MCX4151041.1 TraU family protein [Paraburkholderia madseniana]MCX4176681.1 TraU family protein [Paraburkholderia madseniana]MDN7153973.1 TraU family protein [Paraburkholderia sp. WS6]MDQ6412855.1 TraU family protein [Paraburkholderia madseniana]MDQ6464672.1 TraU family protein [Paraburkholderia madseniana]